MNSVPLVTIITPTYKRPALLAETLASVRSQTFQDWEYIIVDDDHDRSAFDVVSTAAASDPRVRYLTRTRDKAGANVCRNLGISQAKSDLVVLLDDDDLLQPDCLAGRVKIIQRNKDLDFAVFRARIFTHAIGDLPQLYHPQDPGDNLLRFLSLECPWQTSGPIWRRKYLIELGAFDEDLISMQDLELHIRALTARARYLCFPTIDHYIRAQFDPTRTSTRHFQDPKFLQRAEIVPPQFLKMITKAGLLTWSRQRATFGLAYGVAESWARIGEMSQAWRYWRDAGIEMKIPYNLFAQGAAMLILNRFSRQPDGYAARLINRWKGSVRFRQEPRLVNYHT